MHFFQATRDELSGEFTQHLMDSTRLICALAFGYIALNYLVAPLYRHEILLLPRPAPLAIWFVEYGLIAGGSIALVGFRWWAGDHRLAPGVTAVLALVIGVGVACSGGIWRSTGAYFFNELTFYYLFCLAAASGLRFRVLSVISVVVVLVHLGFSLAHNGVGQAARYDVLSGITAIIVLALIAWYLTESRYMAWSSGAYLQRLSCEDELTGLLNRRGFMQRGLHAASQACDSGTPVSIALIDVDDFKAFNDTYGHSGGDAVLKSIARVVGKAGRDKQDHVARLHGDEFVVCWVNMPEPVLKNRIDTLLRQVRAIDVGSFGCNGAPEGAGVTVSIGVATRALSQDESLQDLLKQADAQLYVAKANGRDRAAFSAAA